MYLTHNVLGVSRVNQGAETSNAAYLGRAVSKGEITQALKSADEAFEVTEVPDAAIDAGHALAQDKVVAWYEGRSEFGPRALGHRSLLADPRHQENWSRVIPRLSVDPKKAGIFAEEGFLSGHDSRWI
ncbi:MAG: hypothetical protein O2985_13585, partial [Proteobacteria bacterium]|nr:hypothetical protein [Pseudomonadota bacterium]